MNETTILQTISKQLKSERLKKGYTQKQVADLVGLSEKTISKYETIGTTDLYTLLLLEENADFDILSSLVMNTQTTEYKIKEGIRKNLSLIVEVPSINKYEELKNLFIKEHYHIKVFNEKDIKTSDKYNPLSYLKDDLDVYYFVESLIKCTHARITHDLFWDQAESTLLQSLILYLKNNPEISDDDRNLSSVMKLLQAAEINESFINVQSPLDKLFAKLEAADPKSIAVKQYKTFKMGAGKTLKSILVTCGAYLNIFNLEEIVDITSNDTIHLDELNNTKTVLFVIPDERLYLSKLLKEQLKNLYSIEFDSSVTVLK